MIYPFCYSKQKANLFEIMFFSQKICQFWIFFLFFFSCKFPWIWENVNDCLINFFFLILFNFSCVFIFVSQCLCIRRWKLLKCFVHVSSSWSQDSDCCVYGFHSCNSCFFFFNACFHARFRQNQISICVNSIIDIFFQFLERKELSNLSVIIVNGSSFRFWNVRSSCCGNSIDSCSIQSVSDEFRIFITSNQSFNLIRSKIHAFCESNNVSFLQCFNDFWIWII